MKPLREPPSARRVLVVAFGGSMLQVVAGFLLAARPDANWWRLVLFQWAMVFAALWLLRRANPLTALRMVGLVRAPWRGLAFGVVTLLGAVLARSALALLDSVRVLASVADDFVVIGAWASMGLLGAGHLAFTYGVVVRELVRVCRWRWWAAASLSPILFWLPVALTSADLHLAWAAILLMTGYQLVGAWLYLRWRHDLWIGVALLMAMYLVNLFAYPVPTAKPAEVVEGEVWFEEDGRMLDLEEFMKRSAPVWEYSPVALQNAGFVLALLGLVAPVAVTLAWRRLGTASRERDRAGAVDA